MNRNILKKLKVSTIIAGIVFIIIFGLSRKFFLTGITNFTENMFLDWMLNKKTASSSTVSGNIVIIDIDQITVDKFGQYDQIPREIHAQVIDFLADVIRPVLRRIEYASYRLRRLVSDVLLNTRPRGRRLGSASARHKQKRDEDGRCRGSGKLLEARRTGSLRFCHCASTSCAGVSPR